MAKSRPIAFERLEDRLCLSVFYDFEVLAQTQPGGLSSIEPAVSINDSGNVAFVASDSGGQGIYFHNGTTLTEIATDPSFSYGRELQLNNTNEVGAVRIRSGTRTARIWDATSPNSTVRIAQSTVSFPRPFDHFEGLGNFASLSNDGQLSFAGLETPTPGNGFWEVHLSDSFVDRSDDGREVTSFSTNTVFRQMAADGDRVVTGMRAGSARKITFYDLSGGVSMPTNIADTASGAWSDLGIRPGITDDAQIVAFYGETAAGEKGIFASIWDDDLDPTIQGDQPGWRTEKIASTADGFTSFEVDTRVGVNSTHRGEPFTDSNGDGIWDPGEPFTDSNRNGKFDASQRAVTIVYMGTKNGNKGIYTSRLNFFGTGSGSFDPTNPGSFTVSPSTLVVETNTPLFNDVNGNGGMDGSETALIPGTISDLHISDPVNGRDRGDVAF